MRELGFGVAGVSDRQEDDAVQQTRRPYIEIVCAVTYTCVQTDQGL